MREKTRTGTRTEYKNEYAKNRYDRLNMLLPKGMKDKIKGTAADMGISVSQYIIMLVNADISGTDSQIIHKAHELTQEDIAMLKKWQIAQTYIAMIESMNIDTVSGMEKHYSIILKSGYINDETGSRIIETDKTKELKRIMKKSRKE